MTKKEAAERWRAANARIQATEQTTQIAELLLTVFGGLAIRGLIWVCIGFGVCSVFGLSAWLGLPAAYAASVIIGTPYAWLRRDGRVRALEALADSAEAAKRKKDAPPVDTTAPPK